MMRASPDGTGRNMWTGIGLSLFLPMLLRPLWKDNRVHYAVNCASFGCPNLQPEAYTPENTDTLLEKGAREYVNHPRGVRFAGARLYLSSIYDWFQPDCLEILPAKERAGGMY